MFLIIYDVYEHGNEEIIKNFEELLRINLNLIDMVLYMIPLNLKVLGYTITPNTNGCGVEQKQLIKYMVLQVRSNLQKLREIIKVNSSYPEYTYTNYELGTNVFIFCYMNIVIQDNITEREKHRLIKEKLKELKKTTHKVNRYYTKYIVKPQKKKEHLTKHYVTLNFNSVISGMVENKPTGTHTRTPEEIPEGIEQETETIKRSLK